MTISIQTRMAISDGIHSFFDLVDKGHASKTIDLLTPDAAITFGPGSPHPGTVQGDALRQSMVAREAQTQAFTRHVISNMTFRDAGGAVEAYYLLTLYRSDDDHRGPTASFVADMHDQWICRDGNWLMQSREIFPAFMRS